MRVLLFLPLALAAQQATDTLPATVVLAGRESAPRESLRLWEAAEIAGFAPRSVDELLASDPAFSLYRNQSGIFANPTASGTSLRRTGATAASRSLVLLDGIPQNDPFGGWIPWTRFDPATLDSLAIAPAAESAVWGNLSPAGSIRMTRGAIGDGGWAGITLGSHATHGARAGGGIVGDSGRVAVALSGFGLRSEGFQVVDPARRGAIDRRLDLRFDGADLRLTLRPGDHLTVEPALSFYEEHRGNGTPLTGNATEAFDASLRVTAEDGDSSWQALGYYQRRRFASVFSSVDPARAGERPALDQFHVPGEGIGGALVVRQRAGEALQLTLGGDLRLLDGETNEDAGGFRRRRAGGTQSTAGVFSAARWEPDAATGIDASLRLDRWQLGDGRRLEFSIPTGALLRADFPAGRGGWEPSAALALERELTAGLGARLALSSSYRLPTLNELHRPFRVRNDLTEANPRLDPERFRSIEAGLNWRPAPCLELGATLFHHWIDDAIANVPVTDPAEIAAIFGTLPPGGTGSQRRNVDRARVLGLQASADWQPDPRWGLRLDGLWSETEFTASSTQPLLEGRPFPQSPDLSLVGTLHLRPHDDLALFIGGEYGAARFDDPLATRRLPSYSTLRLGGSWRATESLTIHARIENLLDAEIPTGVASNGIRTYGQPRALWVNARWTF